MSAKVFRDGCGDWWASLTVERTIRYEPSADPAPIAVVGLDVGVKTLAVAASSSAEVLLTAEGAGLFTGRNASCGPRNVRCPARTGYTAGRLAHRTRVVPRPVDALTPSGG